MIGFRFESDWLKGWHDFSGPMRERNHLRKSKEIPGHLTRSHTRRRLNRQPAKEEMRL